MPHSQGSTALESAFLLLSYLLLSLAHLSYLGHSAFITLIHSQYIFMGRNLTFFVDFPAPLSGLHAYKILYNIQHTIK
jgi:hypothetical protein